MLCQAMNTDVDGSTLVVHSRLSLNLAGGTLEQVHSSSVNSSAPVRDSIPMHKLQYYQHQYQCRCTNTNTNTNTNANAPIPIPMLMHHCQYQHRYQCTYTNALSLNLAAALSSRCFRAGGAC